VGKKWKPGNGMALLGAHTDSPALRIKPVSKKFGENGSYIQVGVETYGGIYTIPGNMETI
jgi:aspartyl aminopeptidase